MKTFLEKSTSVFLVLVALYIIAHLLRLVAINLPLYVSIPTIWFSLSIIAAAGWVRFRKSHPRLTR